jgi:hypothetical protein
MDMLMDVGGGLGSLLAAIVARFPSIRAVNFDLPHIIEKAPAIPGVEHVGGDFFKPESLPKAANIIMKVRHPPCPARHQCLSFNVAYKGRYRCRARTHYKSRHSMCTLRQGPLLMILSQ